MLEHCQTAEEHFSYLQTVLNKLYSLREANTIATYLFEDLFQPITPKSGERQWTTDEKLLLERVVNELQEYRPWQYIVGMTEFYGLSFYVDEAVLIPRPETEELVHFIIQTHQHQAPRILDVGTGSGCIAISLKKKLSRAIITAVDVSRQALALAQKNAAANGVEIQTQQLNILDPTVVKALPLYDIIVSNPPYILSADKAHMHANVLKHEPAIALFVTNEDPLQFYKVLADLGREKLHENGWLYVEIHEAFGAEVLACFQQKHYRNCQMVQDMYGKDRIVMAQR